MNENQWLADQFEEHRARLQAVAYRMLGSATEADDAVQEAWLRLSRSGAGEIANLGGWLTTVVVRVCLSMLRSRNFLREEPLEPGLAAREELHPEDEALLADTVGLALQVVLDTLTPDERLAFVLHDMFDFPFEEIAFMLGRSPAAARQLASRARRRVKGAEVPGNRNAARQRDVVSAFFAAARGGDFDALVAALSPDVVLRIDADVPGSTAFKVVRGADAVASQALNGLAPALRSVELHPVLVHGATGVIATRRGRPITVMSFAVADDKIVEIEAVTDPERVQAIAAAVISPG
ncbi:MAG TPA: sigma-70 family RNA polymerase sigma factor [Streptosporangiaceae bacterium]|nr:sigma-70 family RNA polymerase sigma factor [Streptosporangiaceae bacterium]